MQKLEWEPLALPWRGMKNPHDPSMIAKCETDCYHAQAEVIESQAFSGPGFDAWVQVRGKGFYTGDMQRRIGGDDPDHLKRLCEEYAGLFVAALGLARPGGEDGG